MNPATPQFPPPRARRFVRRCAGLTFPAALLAVAGCAIVLGGLIVTDRSVRETTAQQHTRQTLHTLHRALNEYAKHHHGRAPAGPAAHAITTLRSDPHTAPLMRDLLESQSPRLSRPSSSASAAAQPAAADANTLTDGFGTPLHYRPADTHRHRRAAFVSAGPDRRFGDPLADDPADQRAAADNLFSQDMLGQPVTGDARLDTQPQQAAPQHEGQAP